VNGRQLSIIDNISTGLTVNYKYNDSGVRTQKTVNGVKTDFYLDGTKVIYEKTGTNLTYYSYDESENAIGLNYNGVQYYYVTNAQGDIIGLLDSNLNKVCEYTYDSWRKSNLCKRCERK